MKEVLQKTKISSPLTTAVFVFLALLFPLSASAQSFESSPSAPTICRFESTTVIGTGGSVTSADESNQPSETACRQFCNRLYELANERGDISFAQCRFQGQAISWTVEPVDAVKNKKVFYSCVVRYPESVVFENSKEKEQCFDLTKPDFGSMTEGQARSYCYDYCSVHTEAAGSLKGEACFFITTHSCSNYKEAGSLIEGYGGPPFEEVLEVIRGARDPQTGIDQVGQATPVVLVGRLTRIAMGGIGMITLVMFLYGGITWMTARGNTEKAGTAMRIFLWGGLGVIVTLASYAIVDFVFEAFR